MNIALATSWNERCGIASYGENLTKHVKGVDFTIIDRNIDHSNSFELAKDSDILLVNYEPGILGHWTKWIKDWHKPSILILHTSQEGDNRSEFTKAFTKVVVHEKTQDGFTFIPHGIPIAEVFKAEVEFDIGTVGFPFAWKGFTQVVEAAKILNKTCLVIIPESRHADAQWMKAHLQSIYNKVTVLTDWLSESETIRILAGCKVTAFAYHGGNYGISGACRLGLATGNPIILSRSRQFRDLFDYENEIEFVNQPPTGEGVAQAIRNLFNNKTEILNHLDVVKWPSKVLEDMNWETTGMIYKKLFEEIMVCQ